MDARTGARAWSALYRSTAAYATNPTRGSVAIAAASTNRLRVENADRRGECPFDEALLGSTITGSDGGRVVSCESILNPLVTPTASRDAPALLRRRDQLIRSGMNPVRVQHQSEIYQDTPTIDMQGIVPRQTAAKRRERNTRRTPRKGGERRKMGRAGAHEG